MTISRMLAVLCIVTLAACGGGGASSTPSAGMANTPAISPQTTAQLVPTSFAIGVPTATAATTRRTPKYVGAGAVSVQITLNSVNGNAPPMGLTSSVTSTIAPPCTPCSVAGPLVPPGSDNFTFTTFDGSNATGNAIATSTGSYTITAGSANNGNTVTLLGIPHYTLSGGNYGNSGASTVPVSIPASVEDADHNVITGTFAYPVVITDSDTSGATTVSTAGADNPPAGELISSQDTLTLDRTGEIVGQNALTATSNGVANGTFAFGPYLSQILASVTRLDLYAPTGTGSSISFTASVAGWTNAPWNNLLTATTSGCGSIGTISPSHGTSFTFTAVSSPVAGSCTVYLSDGIDPALLIPATYTTSGFGVN